MILMSPKSLWMRCYLSFFFLAVITTASALSDTEEWINFKKNHGKTYKSPEEESYRFSVFQASLRKIEEHNAKFEQGLSTFKMGMNKFGDLTTEEILGSKKKVPRRNRPPTSSETEHVQYNGNIPGRWDWREKGAVTPVKDQSGSGAYWAFSAVGAIESANFIKTGKLVAMSEQNLIDCDTDCRDNICRAENGMEYVEKNGITTEAAYPYTASVGACRLNGTENLLKIKKHVFITPGAEEDLRQVVYNKQPVAAYINAVEEFSSYKSGVFQTGDCFSNEVYDHSVLIVGYGMDYGTGEDYWLVKNSWGTDWGMDGYAWVIRNNNECDIASDLVYPVL